MAVLTLLVQGQTNQQIATHLNIQLSIMKQYIGNILAKLHVRSRIEAAAGALKLGWLSSSTAWVLRERQMAIVR